MWYDGLTRVGSVHQQCGKAGLARMFVDTFSGVGA